MFLGFSLVFCGIFDFLEGVFCFVKTFGKIKTTKNNISKGGSETFKQTLFLLVFPKVFLVVFSFLWFSFVFSVVSKVLLVL